VSAIGLKPSSPYYFIVPSFYNFIVIQPNFIVLSLHRFITSAYFRPFKLSKQNIQTQFLKL